MNMYFTNTNTNKAHKKQLTAKIPDLFRVLNMISACLYRYNIFKFRLQLMNMSSGVSIRFHTPQVVLWKSA